MKSLLYITRLLENEKMSTGRPSVALVVLLRHYRQILLTLLTFDYWVNGQAIQNTVFCLLIYTYTMLKNQVFYDDISKKRTRKMRLQTNCEFQQTKIKQLNKNFNIDMYSTNLRGGKVLATEQKIREIKKAAFKK